MKKQTKKERSDQDLERFEDLPSRTKELQRLKDLAERTSGRERAELDKEIRRRSGERKTSG